MKREVEHVKCPMCKSTVEIDVEFAIKNQRVFCGGCCKAFDIKIQRVHDEKKDEIADELLRKHFERKSAELEEEEMEEEAKELFDLDKGYYGWDSEN
jgi:transcription elongation factor Elf1